MGETRPWLFLDVDGVVSPIRRINGCTGKRSTNVFDRLDATLPPGYRTWPNAIYGMYVPEHLAAWGNLLDACYRVIWCTSWQATASTLVGQPAGLPDWPSLCFDSRRDGRGRVAHKAAAIGQVLAEDPRPYAWVDDCLDAAGRLPPGLARLGLAHLLIRPSLLVGLTDDHIHQLVDFARLIQAPVVR